MAMSYGNVFVARIAMGASDTQTLKALVEAEAFDGPSIVIAFSPCIAHGYDLKHGMEQQKIAAQSGYWPLFRYDPALLGEGKNPLQLDSKPPSIPLRNYMYNETRFTILQNSDPETARELLKLAQHDAEARWKLYEALAAIQLPTKALKSEKKEQPTEPAASNAQPRW